MFIHYNNCISTQQTFEKTDLEILHETVDNKLKAIEPSYEGIPPGILRRMGKAVRMGVGCALPALQEASQANGIIIGTANGGMEDCIRFLNQIIDYEEGMLTPGNFVQSTPNAIAAQLGLMTRNKQYNITHVHRGLAFENALLDAMMKLRELPDAIYLLAAVDEISDYNYNIDYLDGWYKKEPVKSKDLYSASTTGSLAGEGAATFIVNNREANAVACIKGIQTLHTTNENTVKQACSEFLSKHLKPGEKPDICITGENGDSRMLKYYSAVESVFDEATTIARFKHMSGEFPTASAIALWLACNLHSLPAHCIKKQGTVKHAENIIIYNHYKGSQHAFIWVQRLEKIKPGLH
ncbi:MAG: beta-ketoacyl synthase chain length factor [Chitinophagaceae bacterium]|nr:beta-ketoacyl synthase chain length factor [Chitinophagaceae bacterium]